MNTQTETIVRELSLEDLDRVSGAGIRVPELHVRKAGGEFAVDLSFEPNATVRGIIAI